MHDLITRRRTWGKKNGKSKERARRVVDLYKEGGSFYNF